MDRNQQVVERTRTIFAERLDDVLHMVRQDRQDLRGWEEPAHLRAVVRRSIRTNPHAASARQEPDQMSALRQQKHRTRGGGVLRSDLEKECVTVAGRVRAPAATWTCG